MAYLSAKRVACAALGIFAGFFMLPAFAHPGAHHASASFMAGVEHPLFGWDHLLAMLAIGLWAAQQRRPMAWTLSVEAYGAGFIVATVLLHLAGLAGGALRRALEPGRSCAWSAQACRWPAPISWPALSDALIPR